MNVQNMTKYAVGILIGLVMLAGLVIPIVDSAQARADPYSVHNELRTPAADYSNIDFEIIAYPNAQEDGYAYYINGVGFEKPGATRLCLISDHMRLGAPSTANRTFEVRAITDGGWKSFNESLMTTITYNATAHTLTYSSGEDYTFTVPATFVLVWDKDGGYGELLNDSSYAGVVFSKSDFDKKTEGVYDWAGSITLGGTTVNALLAASKQGVTMSTDQEVDWTVTITYPGMALVDGTTDLYSGATPTFVVSDGENSTSLVSQKGYMAFDADGHKTGGPNSALIGVIPLVAIICLVVFAAGAIYNRRA